MYIKWHNSDTKREILYASTYNEVLRVVNIIDLQSRTVVARGMREEGVIVSCI